MTMKPRKTKDVGGDWEDDAQRKPGKTESGWRQAA
jgi:hypothetical protein